MNDQAPDIETSSDDYRTRFSGPVGEFFLAVQADRVLKLLPPSPMVPLKILEVGGGHGQLVEHFLEGGHEVWVHGSSAEALSRLSDLARSNRHLHLFESSMYSLPFDDAFFDVVVGIRITAHVGNIEALFKEWTRVARKRVIFDYAPVDSFNSLYPLLFSLKKRVEKNTRVFTLYSSTLFSGTFDKLGWRVVAERRQFFLPMVFHRALKMPKVSDVLERIFKVTGFTAMFGSPGVIAAERAVAETAAAESELTEIGAVATE